MSARLPSIQKLKEIFGNNALEARQILQKFQHARKAMERLNSLKLDDGSVFSGVEVVWLKRRGAAYYLNAGDMYVPTLFFFVESGTYMVTTFGDQVERYGEGKNPNQY